MAKKLAFIINPISGRKSKKNLEGLIETHIDKTKFTVNIFYTEKRNHGKELAAQLVSKEFDIVAAVGGDGTINEIAGSLLHSNTALAIIPFGSGNGLARHLGVPLETEKAIDLINQDNDIVMDSGTLNGHPFFCTSGVGFDAYIGHEFAKQSTRGFQTYIKSTIKGFISYKPHNYKISSSFGDIKTEAFLITIGNTSQYGNNAFICPFADVQDGLLDVTILKPFPKVYAIDLGRRIFAGSINDSRYSTLFKTVQLTIERDHEGPVHVDGEPMEMGKNLSLKIVPKSLKVIVPVKTR